MRPPSAKFNSLWLGVETFMYALQRRTRISHEARQNYIARTSKKDTPRERGWKAWRSYYNFLTTIPSTRSATASNSNSISRFWFRGNSIRLPLHLCTMLTCQLERQSLQHHSWESNGNNSLRFHYCKSTDLEMFLNCLFVALPCWASSVDECPQRFACFTKPDTKLGAYIKKGNAIPE